MATLSDDPRSTTNPLFNDNVLKLGVFGHNGPGASMTSVPEKYQPSWDNSLRVSLLADEIGVEAIVPYARWRSFGRHDHPSGYVHDAYTWAAATAAKAPDACVMSTCHTSIFHPLVAAKQAATLDHISGGRSALNIVCGWFGPEIDMFGPNILPHGDRYAQAHEWIEIVKRLWSSEEPIDFDGKFFHFKGAVLMPKPVQAPFPALMNAGGSVEGQHFAAKHCDIAFIGAQDPSPDAIKAQVAKYRDLAREEYGRHIQVWMPSYVVQRETEAEARAYLERYVGEYGDHEVAESFMKYQVPGADKMPPEVVAKIMRALMAGAGGIDLVGTAEQIAERLKMLSDCGIDGILLTWIDYEDGLKRFSEVMPMLSALGLRKG